MFSLLCTHKHMLSKQMLDMSYNKSAGGSLMAAFLAFQTPGFLSPVTSMTFFLCEVGVTNLSGVSVYSGHRPVPPCLPAQEGYSKEG